MTEPYCDCAVGRARKWDKENPPPSGKINPLPLEHHFLCDGTGYKPGTKEYKEATRKKKGE